LVVPFFANILHASSKVHPQQLPAQSFLPIRSRAWKWRLSFCTTSPTTSGTLAMTVFNVPTPWCFLSMLLLCHDAWPWSQGQLWRRSRQPVSQDGAKLMLDTNASFCLGKMAVSDVSANPTRRRVRLANRHDGQDRGQARPLGARTPQQPPPTRYSRTGSRTRARARPRRTRPPQQRGARRRRHRRNAKADT
jgi:hypothetical protein